MEDLDTPRCVAGAADDILHTLAAYGLHSDETVVYQSQRTTAYEAALQQLKEIDAVYPCACTRKEIEDSAMRGTDGPVYPGTCRQGITRGRTNRAWRVRTNFSPFGIPPAPIGFDDGLQGYLGQNLATEIGDFVVQRADELFAYQLAVVVDDAWQGITHVVRGCDLLVSTPRQIYLQQLLNYPTPHYLHLPIAINAQGEKLSKQTLAPVIGTDNVSTMLFAVLGFLQQQPPTELQRCSASEILAWAIEHWQPAHLRACRAVKVAA